MNAATRRLFITTRVCISWGLSHHYCKRILTMNCDIYYMEQNITTSMIRAI